MKLSLDSEFQVGSEGKMLLLAAASFFLLFHIPGLFLIFLVSFFKFLTFRVAPQAAPSMDTRIWWTCGCILNFIGN